MKSNLVTIIVPIYDVEKYISKCVDSIINQTYSNIEIILVDDGSPDNCPVICDHYQKIDSRIKVIHKENGGLSDARNAGFNEARGDYVVFVDGDDYVELDMIEKALNIALIHDIDIVQWGFYVDFENDDGELYESLIHSQPNQIISREHYKNLKIDFSFITEIGYAWNKMYKTDFIKSHNFSFTKGLSLIEDIIFNSPVYAASNKIAFIEDALSHYIQRPRITLGTAFYEDYYELKLQALDSIVNLLESWEINSQKKEEVIAGLFFNNLKSLLKILSTSKNKSINYQNKYLLKIFKSDRTQKNINVVKVYSKKDKMILKLMKLNQSRLLLFLYKIMA